LERSGSLDQLIASFALQASNLFLDIGYAPNIISGSSFLVTKV
jgi:hypothetical protein